MISFRKYLDQEKDDLTSCLVRVVIRLLEGISLHAIEHDHDDHVAFRRQFAETIEKFEQTTEGRETLVIAGEVVKSLQIYNQSVEKFIRTLSSEKQSIISAMTGLVLKLSGASEGAAENLRKIEKELAKACQLDDLRLLKGKMQDCMETICQEAVRQEERAEELKTPVVSLVNSHGPYDQVTGLPGLRDAEERIKELREAKRPGYVVAMFLTNLDYVNRRAGYSAGDKILMLVGQKMGQLMTGSDQLFRWRGPCFVAVIERTENRAAAVSEAGKIATIRVEQEIESEGRSLFFKAAIVWTLMGVRDTLQATDISRKIDDFAARHSQLRPNDG